MARWKKITIWAIIWHPKQQNTYQGTLRTQVLTSIGSKTSQGPSLDPTGPCKETLLSRFCQAVFKREQSGTS